MLQKFKNQQFTKIIEHSPTTNHRRKHWVVVRISTPVAHSNIVIQILKVSGHLVRKIVACIHHQRDPCANGFAYKPKFSKIKTSKIKCRRVLYMPVFAVVLCKSMMKSTFGLAEPFGPRIEFS